MICKSVFGQGEEVKRSKGWCRWYGYREAVAFFPHYRWIQYCWLAANRYRDWLKCITLSKTSSFCNSDLAFNLTAEQTAGRRHSAEWAVIRKVPSCRNTVVPFFLHCLTIGEMRSLSSSWDVEFYFVSSAEVKDDLQQFYYPSFILCVMNMNTLLHTLKQTRPIEGL